MPHLGGMLPFIVARVDDGLTRARATGAVRGARHGVRRKPLTTLKVGVVTNTWNFHLPVAVARGMGWFRDAGLEVQMLTVPSGGPVMAAMLISGDVDVMMSGIDAQQAAIHAGAPLVLIGSTADKVDFSLIGAKGLTSVQDLRGGKSVGVTGAGTYSEFTVAESLRRVGLVRNQVYVTRSTSASVAQTLAALYTGRSTRCARG